MAELDVITVDVFKNQFIREFDYLSNIEWDADFNYCKNVEVYYNGNFYKSTQTSNNQEPSPESDYWELAEDSIYNYVLDNDIIKAFGQAKGTFNLELFKSKNDKWAIPYLLLTAHYLIMDMNMANGTGGANFLMTSKSVDGVSASYGVPQKYLQNPYYAYFANTSFGLKYLQYLIPLTIGGAYIIRGNTTIT